MQKTSSAALALFIIYVINMVRSVPFETIRPLKKCTLEELPKDKDNNPKTKFLAYLEDLILDPPCEEDYCTIKKGAPLQFRSRFTPKYDGDKLTFKAYQHSFSGWKMNYFSTPAFFVRRFCFTFTLTSQFKEKS